MKKATKENLVLIAACLFVFFTSFVAYEMGFVCGQSDVRKNTVVVQNPRVWFGKCSPKEPRTRKQWDERLCATDEKDHGDAFPAGFSYRIETQVDPKSAFETSVIQSGPNGETWKGNQRDKKGFAPPGYLERTIPPINPPFVEWRINPTKPAKEKDNADTN